MKSACVYKEHATTSVTACTLQNHLRRLVRAGIQVSRDVVLQSKKPNLQFCTASVLASENIISLYHQGRGVVKALAKGLGFLCFHHYAFFVAFCAQWLAWIDDTIQAFTCLQQWVLPMESHDRAPIRNLDPLEPPTCLLCWIVVSGNRIRSFH